MFVTVALILLVFKLAVTGKTLSQQPTQRSSLFSPATQTMTYTLMMIGMSHVIPTDGIAGFETAPLNNANGLGLMAQTGATWVRRAAVWWPDVEATEGVYTWSAISNLDAEFKEAALQRLQVILIVRGAPSWAQKYTPWACGPIAQAKLAAFGDFMAALVARYSQPPYNVKYYEMGNEEDVDRALLSNSYNNAYGCWGDNTDTYYGGGVYADMLKAVYPRVKQVDSSVQVLIGGLLLDCDPGPPVNSCAKVGNNTKPAKFLEGILKKYGGQYFDGVAYHAYDWYIGSLGGYYNPNFHSDSDTTGPASIAKATFIRNVLRANGVTGKYLMNTESSLLTGSDVNDPDYELTKSYFVAQLYAASHAIDLRSNIWYRVLGWPNRGGALLNADLTARPSYTAFQTVNSMLSGTSYTGLASSYELTGTTNVRGYKFGQQNQTTWVVWSMDSMSHTLTMAQAPKYVYDVFGNMVPLSDTTSITLDGPDKLLFYLVWPRY